MLYMLHADILMHNENKGFESSRLNLHLFFTVGIIIPYIISYYLDQKQSEELINRKCVEVIF